MNDPLEKAARRVVSSAVRMSIPSGHPFYQEVWYRIPSGLYDNLETAVKSRRRRTTKKEKQR